MTGTIGDNQLMKDKYHRKSLDFIRGHWEPLEAFTAGARDEHG